MLWFFIGLGVIVAGGVALFTLISRESRSANPVLHRRLNELAATVNGDRQTVESSPVEAVRFHLGNSQAVLHLASEYGPLRLEYSLPFYLPPVFALRPADAPATMFGRGQVETAKADDPGFNRLYRMITNNQTFVERVMTAEIRRSISSMPLLLNPGSPRISLSVAANQVRFECPSVILDHADLVGFVRNADGVARAVFAALGCPVGGAGGVQIVEVKRFSPTEGVCRVCGEALGATPVFCSRCKTAHHRDCWEYFGSCSIFACTTKTYVGQR